MATTAKKIASGNTLGVSYTVNDRTGTIEGSETRAETEVTGNVSGGGGYSSGGTGFTAPVSGSVQSKTTRYQNIYLKDEDGDDHTIDLVDFLVPCKEGHKVTFFIAKSAGRAVGPYFYAYNHNTREHYAHDRALRSELFPTMWFMIALGIIGVLAFMANMNESDSTFLGSIVLALFAMLLGGAVLWVLGSILGMIRGRAVKNNPDFKRHLAGLTNR